MQQIKEELQALNSSKKDKERNLAHLEVLCVLFRLFIFCGNVEANRRKLRRFEERKRASARGLCLFLKVLVL